MIESVALIEHPVGLMGRLEALVHEARTGRLLGTIRTKNLIVNDGLAFFIDRAKGDQVTIANWWAVGSQVTTPAATEQTLGSEKYRQQISTSRRIGFNQYEVKTFLGSTAANGWDLQECGLFASPLDNTGPMICRMTHNLITKTASITITYIWTGTLTAL